MPKSSEEVAVELILKLISFAHNELHQFIFHVFLVLIMGNDVKKAQNSSAKFEILTKRNAFHGETHSFLSIYCSRTFGLVNNLTNVYNLF